MKTEGDFPFVFECKNMEIGYLGGFSLKIPHLIIPKGSIAACFGPNGSGKTTFLETLAFLKNYSFLKPTDRKNQLMVSGEFYFNGEKINPTEEVKTNLRQKITVVMQNPYLLSGTVFKNISSGLSWRGKSKREIRNKVQEVLSLVGLEGYEHCRVNELSGGEIKRVAIARALAIDPQVLLLDEPLSSIDREGMLLFEALLKKLNSLSKMTIIFSTHFPHLAYRLAHQILNFQNGSIIPMEKTNTFSGTIIEDEQGKYFRTESDVKFFLATGSEGPAIIHIDPQNIILSKEAISSSARNQFPGKIISLKQKDQQVEVLVDIGVHILATITKTSFQLLKLEEGMPIFVSFKSTGIMVL